jgi:hypothetical protein
MADPDSPGERPSLARGGTPPRGPRGGLPYYNYAGPALVRSEWYQAETPFRVEVDDWDGPQILNIRGCRHWFRDDRFDLPPHLRTLGFVISRGLFVFDGLVEFRPDYWIMIGIDVFGDGTGQLGPDAFQRISPEEAVRIFVGCRVQELPESLDGLILGPDGPMAEDTPEGETEHSHRGEARDETLTDEDLVGRWRRLYSRATLQTLFLEFMEGRGPTTYATIGERVYGDSGIDRTTIESLIKAINQKLAATRSRVRFRRGSEHVTREVDPR